MATAVTGLVAAALTTVTAPSAVAADPNFGAPVVGQCSDMNREELDLASYVEAPVDCAGPHTAQVIAVAQMPADLTYESPGLTKFALETCYPAQRKTLGTSQLGVRLTAYNLGYFGPTPEQQAAGARWLRCDLVLRSDETLLPLPGKLKIGKYPFKKSVSRCLAGRDFHVVVCAKKHTYRATAALKVDQKKFPSQKAWQRIGTQRCRTATTSRAYRFSWPSKVGWKVGDRSLVCYSRTRR